MRRECDKQILVSGVPEAASVGWKAQNWFATASVGGSDAPEHLQLVPQNWE